MADAMSSASDSRETARFWWVNHKQTSRQEIDGGYLWSPVRERSGHRSQFYDNLRRARPGDAVLSYANALVGNVGCVAECAFEAAKPTDFGTKGAYWDELGWLLPVCWTPLPIPVRPAEYLKQIVEYLPDKYSPINAKTGFGNQKAYLAEVSRGLFSRIVELAGATLSSLGDFESITVVDHRGLIGDAIQAAIQTDGSLSATEKEALIRSRRGQGVFRSNVLKVESECRFTGLNLPNLLVASHIRPWRSCRSADERLDGCNGLLLAPHVDRLFDLGFITIEDDGTVLVSRHISARTLEQLGLAQSVSRNLGAFLQRQRSYLQYHRDHVFNA
jgi:putative restriction endonuclease